MKIYDKGLQFVIIALVCQVLVLYGCAWFLSLLLCTIHILIDLAFSNNEICCLCCNGCKLFVVAIDLSLHLLCVSEDRNNLEKLTLAVLSHLPTAVLYVHDLSGECGMSPSDQVLFGLFESNTRSVT